MKTTYSSIRSDHYCEMERSRPSKDSSQQLRNSGTVKVLKKGANGTVPLDKVGKNKLFSSDTKKKFSSVKKRSHVEILNTSNAKSKINSPIVVIENETSHVDILQRIQAVGIPKTYNSTLCSYSTTATYQQKLNQPIFQSSVVLMKNLETLKNLEIETRNLLSHKVEKDKKMQKLLNSKVFFFMIYFLKKTFNL